MKYCITIFWGELFLLLTLSTSGCHDGDKGSLWDENIVRFQVDVETDPNGRGGYNVEPDWCVLHRSILFRIIRKYISTSGRIITHINVHIKQIITCSDCLIRLCIKYQRFDMKLIISCINNSV